MAGTDATGTSTRHADDRAVGRAVRAFGGVTLLSRIGGLVRDVLLVQIFGATAVGSAFLAGFAVPNMFRRLFGEGALAASFLPEYAQADKHDAAEGARFASLTIGALAACTLAVTLLAEVAVGVALVLLPADPQRDLSLRLVMTMFPFMPFICIAAILAGMLQVHGRYAAAASGPIVLNGLIIAVGAWHLARGTHGGEGTAYALGGVTVLSGLVQAGMFAWMLRTHVAWTRAWAGAGVRARRMLRRFVPVLIGMGTVQISALLDTLIAMWPIWVGPTLLGRAFPLDEGSNVLLAAAQRLYQFPLGVFGVAVAGAIFPLLSRHADDDHAFGHTLRRGVRLALFIALPASAGIVLVREDAISALFRIAGRGFSATDVARAGGALAGYGAGIWCYSLNHVLTRAFYARGDTSTPMKVSVVMVGVNLALNWTLIWWLREAGLAWSTAVSAAVQSAALALILRRRAGSGAFDRESPGAFVKIIVLVGAMACAVAGVRALMPGGGSWGATALRLAASCGAGAGVYLAGARVLRVAELRWLLVRRGG